MPMHTLFCVQVCIRQDGERERFVKTMAVCRFVADKMGKEKDL